MAWKEAIGRPNCSRCRRYAVVVSSRCAAIPVCSAATPIAATVVIVVQARTKSSGAASRLAPTRVSVTSATGRVSSRTRRGWRETLPAQVDREQPGAVLGRRGHEQVVGIRHMGDLRREPSSCHAPSARVALRSAGAAHATVAVSRPDVMASSSASTSSGELNSACTATTAEARTGSGEERATGLLQHDADLTHTEAGAASRRRDHQGADLELRHEAVPRVVGLLEDRPHDLSQVVVLVDRREDRRVGAGGTSYVRVPDWDWVT